MPSGSETSEMHQELRRVYAQDQEARLVIGVVRRLADPVKPQNQEGRFRPHPLIIWWGLTGMVAVITFCYSSYIQP